MYKLFFKRFFDIVLSLLVLILFSPILVIVSILLSIQNNGKIFFIQPRVGKKERIFNLLKFKTMNDKKGADGKLLKDKDRITLIGNVVRKTSLDELPQIINVLKNNMSLIGPRPLLVDYLPYYSEYHKKRHDVKPGITGLAQTNGRNLLKFSERFNLDVEYTKKITFLGDLKIIFKTVEKILKPKDISMGKVSLSDIDDVGVTKGLAKHYFNK